MKLTQEGLIRTEITLAKLGFLGLFWTGIWSAYAKFADVPMELDGVLIDGYLTTAAVATGLFAATFVSPELHKQIRESKM